MNDLINYFKHKESTLTEIKHFIASNIDDDSFGMSSAFIIFYDKKTDNIHNLFVNKEKFRSFNNDAYQYSFAGGSGSSAFLNIIKNQRFAIPDKTSSLEQAIVRNYTLLSQALYSEITELHTLNSNWGGGFEIIYFDGDKFTRMDNITYLFWNGYIDIATGNYSFNNNIVYNLKYLEDLLVLNVYRTPTDKQASDYKTYIVSPSYRELVDDEIQRIKSANKIDVDNSRICNIFLFKLSNGHKMHTYKFDVSPALLGKHDQPINPMPGFEYMFPNGIYEPNVTIKFNYFENKKFSFEIGIKKEFINLVMSEFEKSIITQFYLPSFKLFTISPDQEKLNEGAIFRKIIQLKVEGNTLRNIAKKLNIPRSKVAKFF